MATTRQLKQARQNTARYRARMRASGMRLIQLWVPDTRSPAFLKAARAQSKLLANDPHEKIISRELETLQDYSGWK
jgi:hypothetical protein